MKAKYFLSLCFAACATMASAQLESKSAYSIYETEDGWQGLRVSYKPIVMDVDESGDLDMNGFSLDYVKAFRVGGNVPLFVEIGAGFQWGQYLDKEEEEIEGIEIYAEDRLTVASINIPVNLAYQCFLSNKVSLTPYVGLNVKGHVLGKNTILVRGGYLGETLEEEESYNLFDKEDMEKNPCKRFVIGWHLGATVTYSRFNLGVSYGTDLTEFNTDTRFKTTAVTLGVNF